MKLTDWCILLTLLGICLFLPLDLRTESLAKTYFLQEEYNRILDRACEDCLLEAGYQETGKGQLDVDRQSVYDRFEELMDLELSGISQADRQKIQACLHLKQFVSLPDHPSAGRIEKFRESLEQQANAQAKLPAGYEFYFPYIEKENWYQNPAGPSFYSLFVPERKGGGENSVSSVFGGSRIRKRLWEAGYGSVQSGSSIQRLP